MKRKSDVWLKAVLSCALFLGTASLSIAQSEVIMAKDSIVYNTFFARTNDELFWNGKWYNCSISPLHTFVGYDSLYANEYKSGYNSYMNIGEDKQYIATW